MHIIRLLPSGVDGCKEITLLLTVDAVNVFKIILSLDDLENNPARRASQSATLSETS